MSTSQRFGALLVAGLFAYTATVAAEPVPVELRQTDDGWQLFRGGEPYFINGAGGDASLEALAAAGANSVRTWGGEVDAVLDEAHALGLTVTVGIWLGHERHGFDYSDPAQVREQLERAREMVLRYRDHPALLLWGVGNETEGFDETTHERVWDAVNDVAAMVQELDPNHPTMVVTAFVHGDRLEYVHRRMPAVDIHGINAYGGAMVVPERMRAADAGKPFVLTEFGPIGPWEMPTTEWGAPYEQTSAEKAAHYRQVWDTAITGMPGQALGGYAFLWGHKMEGTRTWFGMFLEDGSRTAAVDAMSELWTGEVPANLAPVADPLEIDGPSTRLDPGQRIEVSTRITDPDGDDVRAEWVLRPESGDYATGGDPRAGMPDIDGAVIEQRTDGATVRMPAAPGPYRLFLYVRDDAGGAATANLPLLVKGEARTPMPFPVYSETLENMPWVPSGWMGGTEQLSLDGAYTDDTYAGDASIRIRYEGTYGWAGIAWQHPANNWGDMEGGFDVRGAGELELWARGEYGGEKVSFGVGLLEKDRAHPDSGIAKVDDIVLTREWKRYHVPVGSLDLSSIKTGFVVALTGRSSPVTIYLDEIRFIP